MNSTLAYPLSTNRRRHVIPACRVGVSLARASLTTVLLLLVLHQSAWSDRFVMKDGQRIEGVLLNPDDAPREVYEVRTSDGTRLTLAAVDVSQHVPDSVERKRYLELLPRMPADAEGNWKMAEWCRKNRLSAERSFHLEEVVRLDPSHELAHRALGHVMLDGAWVERDEIMQQRGYVRHKGRWMLPQEIAIQAQRDAEEQAVNQWRRTLPMWRKGIDHPDRAQASWQNIAEISDPFAASILIAQLGNESSERVRLLYVDVLCRLDSPIVGPALVQLALVDSSQDVRQASVEKLPDRFYTSAADSFIAALRPSDKAGAIVRIRRAADALRILNEPRAIPSLIDVLVTTHRVKIGEENPGQIGASFGGTSTGGLGADGFSVGSSARIEQHAVQHREVLDALLALSAGANFRFDQPAWRQWYAEVTTPLELDLRRGN